MASDVSDDGPTTVRLPEGIGEWVAETAADLGVTEGTVVVHLLAAYRATESSEALDPADLFEGADADAEDDVREALVERFPVIAAAVDEALVADAADADADGSDGDIEEMEEHLATRIERVESAFTGKLSDVRERVVQVKRETDAKADAERTDERLVELASAVEDLEAELETATSHLAESGTADADRLADLESRLEDLESLDERFDQLEERLGTVAWVVSDLRDEQATADGRTRAIDRLKRSAATADIDRAVCERCGEAVDIALLTEASCPHCEATVTDVRPASGFFGNAKLTGPERLEPGPDDDRSTDAPTGGDRT